MSFWNEKGGKLLLVNFDDKITMIGDVARKSALLLLIGKAVPHFPFLDTGHSVTDNCHVLYAAGSGASG